jgi:hypothetical protein
VSSWNCRLDQGKAVDGGAADGGQVVVVGLVAGVGRLAELLGGERMNDAHLESAGGKGPGGRMMISARAFDGDDEIAQTTLLDRLAQGGDGGIEAGTVVFDDRRLDDHVAIEIRKHPFGSGLGAVDGDDAEVLGSDLLNAGMNDPAWLLQNIRPPFAAPFTLCV